MSKSSKSEDPHDPTYAQLGHLLYAMPLKAIHADGQYHVSTFQTRLKALLGIDDAYFLLVWDVPHWID